MNTFIVIWDQIFNVNLIAYIIKTSEKCKDLL